MSRASRTRVAAAAQKAPAPPPPPAAALPRQTPRWLRWALVACTAALLLAFCAGPVGDSDTWWHLKTGQYIVQNHKLPVPDPFAYTTYLWKPAYQGEEITRYFNLTHEWGAQVFLYAVYALAGFPGMVVIRAVWIAGFCGLAGWIAWRRTRRLGAAVAVALAVMTVAHNFAADRPQYLTFVFLALTLVILDARRPLWLLPAMMLVWANCHAGFFLGWVATGAYCAEALWLRLRGRPQPDERALWGWSIAAVLISGLNPNYFRVLEVMRYYRQSSMQSQIWEWQYPKYWEVSPFTVMLYGGALILLLNWRRVRIADALLMAAFGAAGLLAFRNIILTVLVGSYILATYLPESRQKADWRGWLMLALLAVAGTGAALASMPAWVAFGLLGIAVLFWHGRWPAVAHGSLAALLAAAAALLAIGGAVKLEAADWNVPKDAADFLLQHHIKGRMFNTYAQGGYLLWRLWPAMQVYVDGRALNEKVFQDGQRIGMNADAVNGKSGEELLREYGIDIIIMDSFEQVTGTAYYLPAALADPSQKEWKLVYHDIHDVIYMKHPPADVPVLNSLDALGAMEKQCAYLVGHGSPACSHGMADVFSRIGDGARAREWLDLYNSSNIRKTYTIRR
ncbi:MAG TPA: hypothetical protein VKX45_13030 [Bryobacteraceae bacterium]|jgi:hypothetical protein|nr:hypothetical protein [Bryobacteraceae bacterium]